MFNFCPSCGHGELDLRIPALDDRPRQVCAQCDTVHYHNPKMVCGALLTHGDRVLLARRSIEPRCGYWTLPAGFMENGETTQEAAAREAREEACAVCDDMSLYGLYSLPQINQVYVMYRGSLRDGFHEAGDESFDTDLFLQEDIPWDKIAFPIVTRTLRRFFDQRAEMRFAVFDEKIERPARARHG